VSENVQKLVGIAVMALIVVLGLAIPGQEQVNSFQRNSVVSSASLAPSLPTSPTADKSRAVQARIQSQVEKISDITAEISAVLKELQALEPPSHPGEDAKEGEIKEYEELLQAFQQVVSGLNQKLEDLEAKFAKPHTALKLMYSDLLQAQPEDVDAFADCVTKRIGRIRLESHTRNAISGCLQEAPKSPKPGIEID
tara:strand:- start:348 stop:935 length:588 start_codon:yes stop_codon:yes gene_type:complete